METDNAFVFPEQDTQYVLDVSTFMDACGQLTDTNDTTTAELYRKLVAEEAAELAAATTPEEELDAIFDTVWCLIGLAVARGYDFAGAWEEGANSNFAKIDKATGKVIKNEYGKVQKPDGWKKPDFSKFV